MKYFAVGFGLLIVALVILADQNAIPPFIQVLYNFKYGDKVGHFVLFGLLNIFVTLAVMERFTLHRLRVALWVGFALAVAVALEEISQQFFAARTFDLMDLAASLAGLFVGAWWVLKIKPPTH